MVNGIHIMTMILEQLKHLIIFYMANILIDPPLIMKIILLKV